MVSQYFGGNPAYYAKFGTKGHMGVDFQAAHGTPVYAAHDGFAFYVGPDEHGGDGVYIRFEDEDAPGRWWTVINWHLCATNDPQYAPKVDARGRRVMRGDLIGYADNTGAPFESTGDHLHFGLAPCNMVGRFLYPDNGFGGCVDPMPYFTTDKPGGGLEPEDRVAVLAATAQAAGDAKQAGILWAIVRFIKSFTRGY